MKGIRVRRNNIFSTLNMVPYLDVMLVLLIIFMVTAPLSTQRGLQVQLPKANMGESRQSSDYVLMSIDAKAKIALQYGKGPAEQLAGLHAVQAWLEKHKVAKQNSIVVHADKSLEWDKVMQAIAQIHRLGWQKITFMAESTNS